LHLPQFHPIPENNEWWGQGFTEWTSVTKATPRFPGHYQPHLPKELGFYDLRLPEARAAQAALAREYGITGFCYYHYWFEGKRLLERPVNDILSSGEPEFPFCLCWANENWTRRWDGHEQNILMEQRYSTEDDLNHIRWLAKAFADPRYIRIDGKPLLAVYRISKLPNPQQTVEVWRQECERLGIGEIFVCNIESFRSEHGLAPRQGLDGAIEFAPDYGALPKRAPGNWLTQKLATQPKWLELASRLGLAEPWFVQNKVYSYPELVANMLAKPAPSYLSFPCVTPSWDNSARRPTDATIYVGSTPEAYGQWLKTTVEKSRVARPHDPVVFINAWNEWAEGNHLEPCIKWGRAYLEATRAALL
jgi:lipopolysaccharide biosynthesis protein